MATATHVSPLRNRTAVGVSWFDTQTYVEWLSRITGQNYRLLSEAEWEYAARAGTQTAYPWGEEIGKANANCNGCGSKFGIREAKEAGDLGAKIQGSGAFFVIKAPVGSFAPNPFGLYDMNGDVYEWVEDCQHDNYNGAPTDGSPWIAGGNCLLRVLRGGSWRESPQYIRSASRAWFHVVSYSDNGGFRVGRTLTPCERALQGARNHEDDELAIFRRARAWC
jgi:formylglycine-generating enzyme required for sulfatase activity